MRQRSLLAALRGYYRISSSIFPTFKHLNTDQVPPQSCDRVIMLDPSQVEHYLPSSKIQAFQKDNKVTIDQPTGSTIYISHKMALKRLKTSKDTIFEFSTQTQQLPNFLGLASYLFTTAYKFSRRSKQQKAIHIFYNSFQNHQYVLQLAQGKINSKQWANMRGNQGTTQKFLQEALRISQQYSLKITTFKGKQLLEEGFRLMHAVGRASDQQPIFINLQYRGNPNTQQFYSFIGKGVCFDSGGLNLKSTAGIKQMHLDKHGATSVLSAFQSCVRLQYPINLTVSIGLVENFVSSSSYRPLDIIQSRKGLSVQIGNTDAQGRLVLADCMHWTQQYYKVKQMVQLSTLTGAIVIALGHRYGGLFSNSNNLSSKLLRSGQQVQQRLWRMPLDEYHDELIECKHCDISNAPGKSQASSSQAAAFLKKFVEKEVQWVHIDMAGMMSKDGNATGFGAQLLQNYIKRSII